MLLQEDKTNSPKHFSTVRLVGEREGSLSSSNLTRRKYTHLSNGSLYSDILHLREMEEDMEVCLSFFIIISCGEF